MFLSQLHLPVSPAPWRAPGVRLGTCSGPRFAGLALALGLAAGSAGAEVQGFQYVRDIAVPAAGWVRVPLDLAAVRHMAPGGADLHVFSRTGGEVPLRIEPAPPRSESRPVESFRLVPGAGAGWFLLVDVGPEPVPHQRLLLTPVRSPFAPPDRVESSPDGTAWQPLAQGGPQTVEGKAAVAYPVTPDRYLRLRWPRRPEAPRVSAVEVESVIAPGLSVTSPNADCRPGPPGALVCTLSLPAAGQTARRLTLEVEGKGMVGYRVYAPRDARWIPLAEGVWQPSSGRTRQLVTLAPGPVAGAVLRLELQGSVLRPRLAGWGVDLDPQTAVFRADAADTYTLAYGGGRRDARRAAPPATGPAVWIAPGPERERDLPALPLAATAPSVRLSERRLAGSWRIAAPSARPGTLVRLEIPALVYGVARADLGNLRLLSGDRQIPFQRWSPEDPALASSDRDLRLQGSGGRRSAESEVELHLPEPGLPLSQIELTAPAAPLRRPTALRYLEPASTPAREVRRRERPVIIHDTWECRPQPPLPCRGLLPLPGHAPSVVEVSFHDGDNPPLASLGADLWRRRDVLLFVWPESEETVRLVAGPEALEAPSYDLQSLGAALLSYPWQPAELGQGRAPVLAHPWWGRWVRPMILLAAVLGLLLLLRRILEEA